MEALADRPHWLVSGALLGSSSPASSGRSTASACRAGIAEISDRFSLAGGGFRAGDSYGWLAEYGPAVTAAALLGGGVLIGLGTRSAGGCTSGHGIGGTALGSKASFVATMVLLATAIGAALLDRAT